MNKRWLESALNTTGLGSDYPGSSGDRERGKFRPSAVPRYDTVAVANDDGTPVSGQVEALLREILLHQKAIVLGLSQLVEIDLLREAAK